MHPADIAEDRVPLPDERAGLLEFPLHRLESGEGEGVTATATGLLRTCSRIAVHVSIASAPESAPRPRRMRAS